MNTEELQNAGGGREKAFENLLKAADEFRPFAEDQMLHSTAAGIRHVVGKRLMAALDEYRTWRAIEAGDAPERMTAEQFAYMQESAGPWERFTAADDWMVNKNPDGTVTARYGVNQPDGGVIYYNATARTLDGAADKAATRAKFGEAAGKRFIPCDRCGRPKTQTVECDGCLWHYCDSCRRPEPSAAA